MVAGLTPQYWAAIARSCRTTGLAVASGLPFLLRPVASKVRRARRDRAAMATRTQALNCLWADEFVFTRCPLLAFTYLLLRLEYHTAGLILRAYGLFQKQTTEAATERAIQSTTTTREASLPVERRTSSPPKVTICPP